MTALAGAAGLAALGAVAAFAATTSSATSTARKPVPVFGHAASPLAAFTTVTAALSPQDTGEIAVQVARRATCSLTLRGPGKMHAGPYLAFAQQTYALWKWTVPASVRGGTWTGTVACTAGKRTKRTLVTHIAVAPSDANSGAVVARGSMAISVVAAAPTPIGAPADATGKGGGGYPNDGAVCIWTGLQQDKRGTYCKNASGSSWYDWGYKVSGKWVEMSPRGFVYRNCTDFVAWYEGLTWSNFHFSAGKGNAADWKDFAGNAGYQVTGHPSVGDIAWWGTDRGGGYGHVAEVTAVNSDGSVTIAEYNGDAHGNYDTRPNVRAEAYLHKPSAPSQPPATTTAPPPTTTVTRTVTTAAPTTAAPTTTQQVTPAPTTTQQAPTPTTTTQQAPPPTTTQQAAPAPTTTQQATPPPARTYSEQASVHHVVHTFTNYHNASGQGPDVGVGQWVQVTCKVHDGTIASVNPDGYWYRIASSPWNNSYYAPANTFMNGDPANGPYTHNTDFSVSDC